MSKKEFMELLSDPKAKVGISGGRFSWVNLYAELEDRKDPFTVSDVAEHCGQPRRYVYGHLRDWVADKKLHMVNLGGKNFYMAPGQVEKAKPAPQ